MKRVLLALMMMIGLTIPYTSGALAQPASDDRILVSATTDIEIDLGETGLITFLPGDYEIRDTPPVLGEYVWFTYNGSNFQVLLIGGSNDTLSSHDATMQNMIDGYDYWNLIAEEIDDEYSWFVGEAELQGNPIVVFYSFELDAFGETDLMVMQFATPETLKSDLEFVQSEVTIAGSPILSHINADAVAVVAGVELTADQPESQDNARSSSRSSQSNRQSSSATAGWESLGLVSDSEWLSPSYGTSIFWDTESWVFPAEYEFAIVIDGEPPLDRLALQLVDESGYAFVTVDAALEGESPQSLHDFWTSTDHLASFPNGATLRASALTTGFTSVIVETSTDAGDSRIVLQEAFFLEDGTVVIVQLWANPLTVIQVYSQYLEGILINGLPVGPVWTIEDIAELYGG